MAEVKPVAFPNAPPFAGWNILSTQLCDVGLNCEMRISFAAGAAKADADKSDISESLMRFIEISFS